MSIRSQAIEWQETEKKLDTDIVTPKQEIENLCKNMTQVKGFQTNELQKHLTKKLNNKLNTAIGKLKKPMDEMSTNYIRGYVVLAEEILADIEIINKKVDIEVKK